MAEDLLVERVTSEEGLQALRPEWNALERVSGVVLPFQTWEWCLAWWQHLREDSRGIRDLLRVFVVRNASGEAVAIAPLILTERPALGPLRVRHLQFVGADPNITEIKSMLCRVGCEEQAYVALRGYVDRHGDEWDWIAWDGLPLLSTHTAGIHAALASTATKSSYVLALAPNWASMRTRLGRNVKESLRKCYNSLKRDGLIVSLETVDQPAAIQLALDDFFTLHAARASLRNAPRHADVFESEQARTFLVEVCQLLAARGVTRIFRLRVNGTIAAVRLGFEIGQSLYLYYSGWDPRFAQYSVMTTLLAEVLQDAIKRGVHSVNLSTGKDVSKTRWGPDEVTYLSGLELSTAATKTQRRVTRILYFGHGVAARLGRNRIARAALPSFLVRRSGKVLALEAPVCAHGLLRLHSLAAAAAVLVALDLLDSKLDGAVHMLPKVFSLIA